MNAEERALALCALLGIDGGKIADEQLPTHGQERYRLIADELRFRDRQWLDACNLTGQEGARPEDFIAFVIRAAEAAAREQRDREWVDKLRDEGVNARWRVLREPRPLQDLELVLPLRDAPDLRLRTIVAKMTEYLAEASKDE